ncbi:MAG: hypothetical protein QM642_10565, partial [Edaphocola sp.]
MNTYRMCAIFLVLLPLVMGCNKNNGLPDGEGSASFNGEQWEAKAIWATNGNYDPTKINISMGFNYYHGYG